MSWAHTMCALQSFDLGLVCCMHLMAYKIAFGLGFCVNAANYDNHN